MQLERVIRYLLFFLTMGMLGASTVIAQDPGMSQAPSPTAGSPSATAGAGDMPSPTGGPNMSNMNAALFVRSVFESDLAQIQMSQLAQEKSNSEDVKQFSEQMVNVHTKLDEQLAPMAKELGVDKPKGPSKKYKKEMEKLQSLSGESFDTEYLRVMANEQQDAIKRFDKESKDTLNPAAMEAAKADGPVLEQNYQVLEKIAQAHNVNLQEQAKK